MKGSRIDKAYSVSLGDWLILSQSFFLHTSSLYAPALRGLTRKNGRIGSGTNCTKIKTLTTTTYYDIIIISKGGNNMKQTNMKTNEEEKIVIFEADDVNDPEWDEIIHVLKLAGIETRFADGNWMNFVWTKKN